MKKKKPVIKIIIILALGVILTALYLWQKNNIDAFIAYKQYSADEISIKQIELESAHKEIIKELEECEPKSFPKGERLISLDTNKFLTQKAEKFIESNKQANSDAGITAQQDENSASINDIIGRMYSLRGSYSGQIDSLLAQAKGEAAATPSKKRTASWKSGLLSRYASKAGALERQCDSQMSALLSELEAELKKTGRDTGLVSEIRSLYYREKSVKKASVLSQYSTK